MTEYHMAEDLDLKYYFVGKWPRNDVIYIPKHMKTFSVFLCCKSCELPT